MRIKNIILLLLIYSCCHSQNKFDTTGVVFTKIYGIDLGKSSIKRVKKLLGVTKDYQDSDAANSSHRVNYYIKKDHLYITFDSGEMGGDEIVTSFYISKSKPKEKYFSNSSLSLTKSDIPGIRLGMSRRKFINCFPSKYVIDKSKDEYAKWDFSDRRKKPDVFISFSNKIQMTKKEMEYFQINNPQYAYYDEVITIIPTFSNNILVKLEVNKITSY